MSRFQKLSHVIWHCQYHIVWVPKYRYKVLKGKIGEEVRKTIIVQSERLGCEIVELNVQVDHVHLLIKVPPKVSVSALILKKSVELNPAENIQHKFDKPIGGMS